MEKLTITERDDLFRLEGNVERGLAAWFEAANAMHEIETRKLYRETHESFAAYCKERWNLGLPHVRTLIKSAKATDSLVTAGLPEPPSTTQALQLARLSPDKAQVAWRRALEASQGRPTAAIVKAEVEKLLPPQPQRGARAVVKGIFRRIPLPLTDEQFEFAKREAAGRRISLGAFFRDLLNEYMRREIKRQREHEARVAAA